MIRHDLHAGISGLEWTVNAYTLTFAVLLLTGAALGDRFGRRRMFAIGLTIFTLASAAAALAPTIGALDAARAVQGLGGAIVMPLTLTILSAGVPKERRGLALGAWGGISGLAVAFGPLVGGAVVSGISWHWIFWLNVPIGLVLLAARAAAARRERRARRRSSTCRASGSRASGLFGIVWGLVRGNSLGWGSPEIVGALVAGALVTALFVAWELRTEQPMLPMRFFRNRTFALANVASLLMFFGMFGVDLPARAVLPDRAGLLAAQSGLRILPWTAMPMVVAPIAGALSDRIGGEPHDGHRARAAGDRPRRGSRRCRRRRRRTSTSSLPFAISGVGMAMFFAPVANVVLSSVRPRRRGRRPAPTTRSASSAACFGVAVLASIFSHYGGYGSGESFVDGMTPAVYVGAAVVAVGSLAAFAIRLGRRRAAGRRARAGTGERRVASAP